MTATIRLVVLAALTMSAACTVHGDKTPPLTGPSEFALSVAVSATPDSIPQDGASQASIAVTARDVDGNGIASLRLRIDMALGDAVQDYGVLSTRTITTGTDGRASATYTAPPPAASLAGGSGTLVSFNVTPIGSNYQTAHSASAAVRLVPPGQVLPTAGTPTAIFSVTPTPLLAGVAANFDASRSCATAAPCSSTAGISSFAWTFGDGTSGFGQTTTHSYATSSSHQVTLTVTNDRGVSGFSSQTIGVTASALPTADFVFSPSAPQIAGTTPAVVNFNGSTSKAAVGRMLAEFIWDFGDGRGTQQGSTVTYSYSAPGTYAVVLTVVDDLGAKSTTSKAVTVANASTGTALADFVYSPTAPVAGTDVSFNAALSHAASGHTLAQFIWDFGDGGGNMLGASTMVHRYAAAGVYNTLLTIVDDAGTRTSSAAKTVTVAPVGAGVAIFSFSPTGPTAGTDVSFNGAASHAAAGHTLAQFIWDFGDGAANVVGASTIVHRYNAPGTFNAMLTVVDDTGVRTTSAPQPVTVAAAVPPGGTPPVASFSFSPTDPRPNSTVNFNADQSQAGAGHTLARFVWNFGDGGGNVQGTSITQHTFTAIGTYTVALTVFDDVGQQAITNHLVTVAAGELPTAAFIFSPADPALGVVVTFNAAASHAATGHSLSRLIWNFGDNTPTVTLTDTTVTHVFVTPGAHAVTLTVVDDLGASASSSQTVTVR
jgi:PKD repeat protein